MEVTKRDIEDSSDVVIESMAADWTTKPYNMSRATKLGIHLFWDDPSPLGTITLEYSCDPFGENDDVDSWVAKTVINVDGTFENLMILDSDLAIAAFRLVWARTSGSGTLKAYITRKP